MPDPMQRPINIPLSVVAFIALVHGNAAAQIVPIGPFTGQQSDGFEAQSTGPYVVCAPGRVFNNTADLCDATGAAGVFVSGGIGSTCSITPHSGSHLFGCFHPSEFTLDQPASRFGGYFGTVGGQGGNGGGFAEFYDGNGALLAAMAITAPDNCSWTWNGWQASLGEEFSRVKIVSNATYPPNFQGLMEMDDLEIDYGGLCLPSATYCVAKTNSLGCVPSISCSGLASYSGADNFYITASNVLNGKKGQVLWSLNQGSSPFLGGTLCLSAPITRTPVQTSSGTPPPPLDCSGTYSYHFSQTYMISQLLPPGTRIYAQYWSRDKGFVTPNDVGLTNALSFFICP